MPRIGAAAPRYDCGELLNDPVFASAAAELQALGFRFSDAPVPGAIPYGLVAARSNRRWWLIPLTNGRVAAAGLALCQPVLAGAMLLRGAAAMASSMGLSTLWARRRLYVSGDTCLADVFRERELHYAFFTGTDSPHRKVAVQVMDGAGNLKGYAKVARSPAVKPLLSHEAHTLRVLRELELKAALVPSVLHCGETDGAALLVTSTRKTRSSRTMVGLNRAHVAFVRELGEKTPARPNDGPGPDAADGTHQGYAEIAGRLPAVWHRRLDEASVRVAQRASALPPRGLSHGDFTPWNTFFVDGRLYVFDWEYAEQAVPVGHDLVHFCLSLPAIRRRPARAALAKVRVLLRNAAPAAGNDAIDVLVLDYLRRLTLRYVAREPLVEGRVAGWPGEPESASYLDVILEQDR